MKFWWLFAKRSGDSFARRVLQGSGSWKFNVLNVEYRISIFDFRSEEARLETFAYRGMKDKKRCRAPIIFIAIFERGY